MTISTADNTPRISYTVNQGVTQTAFSVPFEFFADADLNVYVDGTKKTLATHYTTSANAQNNSAHVEGETGYIHTTTGNSVVGATGGSTVVITRDIVLSRTSDFPIAGAFDIKELNDELDRNIAIASDLNDLATRTIRLKDFDTGTLELPIVTDRANSFIKFDSSGNLTTSLDTEQGTTTFTSTAAASETASPSIILKRDVTASGGSRVDHIGEIKWQAQNDASELLDWSRIAVKLRDDDDGDESVQVDIDGVKFGSFETMFSMNNLVETYGTDFTFHGRRFNIESPTGSGTLSLLMPDVSNTDRTLSFPDRTDTLVTRGAGEILSAKTLDYPKIAHIDSTGSSSSSHITLDAGGDIRLDADNGNIFFQDDTTTFGSATNSSGNLIIKSGTTTALTFDSANVTAGGNFTVTGDLTVNGDTVTVNTATLSVEDPLIILAKANNSSDSVDIGFYGLYDTSGSQDLYAGLFRDANDSGKWKLFKDLQEAPTTTVNTSGGGYAVGTLVANLEGNVTGDVTGNVSGTAGVATSITASANNSEDETVYPTFVDGATGTQGLETDTGLTYNPSSGVLTATQFTGALSGNATSATTATTATNANHVSVADNENEDENNLIPFIEDASATGNVGLESDGDLTYNPSTGRLSATQLAGTLQTASQTNITGVGTISTGVWNGSAIADGYISSSSTWNAKVDTGGTGLTKVGTTLNVDAAQSGITSVGTLTSLTTSGDITFEGATADAHETTFTVTDPTQDNTITLPDTTGTVALTSPNILAGTLLTTTTVSDDATVDFNSTYVTSTYDHYDLLITGLIPATDNTWLGLRFGTANSVDSGSTKYSYMVYYAGASNSDGYQINYNYDGQSSAILLTTVTNFSMGTGTGEGLSMHIRCWDLSSTSLYKKASPIAVGTMSSGTYFGQSYASVGGYKEASAVNFISLYASSGNLASGTVSLYGIKKG